jgi:hypothetical protein
MPAENNRDEAERKKPCGIVVASNNAAAAYDRT